jgi:hypothetical protein
VICSGNGSPVRYLSTADFGRLGDSRFTVRRTLRRKHGSVSWHRLDNWDAKLSKTHLLTHCLNERIDEECLRQTAISGIRKHDREVAQMMVGTGRPGSNHLREDDNAN